MKDELFEQLTTISKAYAYDIIATDIQGLKEQNKISGISQMQILE